MRRPTDRHAVIGCALAILVLTTLQASGNAAATVVPLPAPRPTSTEASPGAPDPHPPLGARAPNGAVPGGDRLAGRTVLVPTGAPPLPKNIPSRSWILVDLDAGTVLAARDPHGRYQPASILKTLTAITVLPHLPGRLVVTVSPAAAQAEGSAVGLLAGASYTVDQLFAALMLVSGNDAAAALAEANGGVAKTVAQMNAKAAELGAYDTKVQTPSGLDGWQQLTSAYDMALILRAAVSEPRFVAYDRLPSASYPPKTSRYGHVEGYEFDNQSMDFMTEVPGALVAKTGYTDAARHTYLCAARRGGRRLGVVLLRGERVPLDQYHQAGALLNWGYALKPTAEPVGMLQGPIAADAPVSHALVGDQSPSTAPPTTRNSSIAPSARGVAGQATARGSFVARLTPATGLVVCLVAVPACAAIGQRLRRRRTRRPR